MKNKVRVLLWAAAAALVAGLIIIPTACSQGGNEMVLIQGGSFTDTKSNYYGQDITVPDFYMSKYEVTQKEWTDVMGSNPSHFQGDNLPVDTVSWYDSVEYCNKRSEKEGLTPYYNIDESQQDPNNHSQYDAVKWIVTTNPSADGYRLPTEQEWEYAAEGGQKSKNYTYSGSNQITDVAWCWLNSGKNVLSGDWNEAAVDQNQDATHAEGAKKPNELGLYDMSGNVREWCYDWYDITHTQRVWRGGGWMGEAVTCTTTYRGQFTPDGKGSDQGFRVCRNAASTSSGQSSASSAS